MASEVSHHSYSSLHFVLFPFMAQGHMIPMVDIARLLAKRGVTITIITTPNNAARFKNVLHRAIESGLHINVLHVKFPHQEAGLPEGQENVDFLESMGSMATFLKAVNILEEPVQKLIQEMTPRPSCIISDMCLYYTNKIAKRGKIGVLVDKEGVKRAVEELMGDCDDAKERRRRAKELGELAHKAVEEGGSSHANITLLLEDIMEQVKSRN
ncbi:hypothetical protein Bca52824_003817 [Brassica carinata]|uniref:Uncharacterized protein n=1 Tax=Brassica carinata TaxID=52824 RepID=A0A8X8BG51_BRACI|nr:hypothetical protein Bca52824_003817 [Brassica carinata]